MRIMHVAVHSAINSNAGDIVLADATRRCFEHFLGPIDWTLQQAWDSFDATVANEHDAVVVGGGGMLLPDQDGASYAASGWQWNCAIDRLEALQVPLIVFGIGWNLFRGQKGLAVQADTHLRATQRQAVFFSLRERATCQFLPGTTYQPCPTSCLWQLGDGGKDADLHRLGINVAMDRPHWRYPDGQHTRVHAAIAKACVPFVEAGWDVCVLNHKPHDATITEALSEHGVTHTMHNLWSATPQEIVACYAQCSMVIGMRSHAQLIAFGLRIPCLSIISHDKLARFLDDIGHPAWGVDVQSTLFPPQLKSATYTMSIRLDDTYTQIAAAQERLWAKTRQNMAQIQAVLHTWASCS